MNAEWEPKEKWKSKLKIGLEGRMFYYIDDEGTEWVKLRPQLSFTDTEIKTLIDLAFNVGFKFWVSADKEPAPYVYIYTHN